MDMKPNSPFTDSSSAFDKLSPPHLLEDEFEPFDSPFDDEISRHQDSISESTEYSSSYCEICNVNIVKTARKKRKYADEELQIPIDSKICDTCVELRYAEIAKDSRKNAKTAGKRKRAKANTAEHEMSASLKKLIAEQE